jgi:transposase
MRLMALHLIASGETAEVAASKLGVHRGTVSVWVHRFNESGLERLASGWKGSPGRILSPEQLAELKEVVAHHPREVGIKHGRWPLASIGAYIKKVSGKKVHRDTGTGRTERHPSRETGQFTKFLTEIAKAWRMVVFHIHIGGYFLRPSRFFSSNPLVSLFQQILRSPRI